MASPRSVHPEASPGDVSPTSRADVAQFTTLFDKYVCKFDEQERVAIFVRTGCIMRSPQNLLHSIGSCNRQPIAAPHNVSVRAHRSMSQDRVLFLDHLHPNYSSRERVVMLAGHGHGLDVV